MYVKRKKLDKRSFSEKADKHASSSASPGKYVQFPTAFPLKNTQQGCLQTEPQKERAYIQAGERKRKGKKTQQNDTLLMLRQRKIIVYLHSQPFYNPCFLNASPFIFSFLFLLFFRITSVIRADRFQSFPLLLGCNLFNSIKQGLCF